MNRNKIILLIIGILALSAFYKINATNQEQNSINATQTAQIAKLKAKNKKLTAQQVSFENSSTSTTTTKNSVDKKAEHIATKLFSNLNNWNADNWLEKQQIGTKYATDDVLTYLGGGQSTNNQSIAAKQLKQLNATSQLTESNIYFEKKSADNEIKGIFIGTVKTTSSGNQTTNNIKYQFTYDTKQGKITEISTF
ncbi:hypothetical protein KBX49_01790 [Liquorilactobacillus satsumensis]|uniref:hypothetical protein n=1 Tax=Liquorilactobacillus satsumensis TaxID=259059 RepID=UPI0021C46D2E|nr:hypothetical protein [Liquorilactobacillus satsumensis]MCP9356712.1 hypothetical protein [Liquorilactobacillus satsumensis]MCP9370652.1 hypothetical protein [Liquorilactobacillus satsumensis]